MCAILNRLVGCCKKNSWTNSCKNFEEDTPIVTLFSAVGIGPSILGAFVPIIAYRGVYISMAILAMVAGIFYLIFNKKTTFLCKKVVYCLIS